jgi:23S rRNA pseudouridine1911/1915/1917 synthase
MKTITIEVDGNQKPLRLDSYLSNKIERFSRSRAKEAILAGMVMVDGRVQSTPNKTAKPGQIIEITFENRHDVVLTPEDIPLNILFENDDVIILSKPAGLVVHPAHANWDGTLAHAVLHHMMTTNSSIISQNKKEISPLTKASVEMTQTTDPLRPGIIHRLDKDTSGVMVVAKSDEAKFTIQKQFQQRTVKKIYTALTVGILPSKSGLIDSPIGRDPKDRKKMTISPKGKSAKTAFEVQGIYTDKQGNSYTLIEVELLTGRTHQIRVHFASIGYPLLGDIVYGSESPLLPRQFLHATTLCLTLDEAKGMECFTAPLENDLKEVLKTMRSQSDILT